MKEYILTTHNAESKDCAPELTLEECRDLDPQWQIYYTKKELLK